MATIFVLFSPNDKFERQGQINIDNKSVILNPQQYQTGNNVINMCSGHVINRCFADARLNGFTEFETDRFKSF